jgi:hypothetical protein
LVYVCFAEIGLSRFVAALQSQFEAFVSGFKAKRFVKAQSRRPFLVGGKLDNSAVSFSCPLNSPLQKLCPQSLAAMIGMNSNTLDQASP